MQPEIRINLTGRVGFVESVKVNAADFFFEQVRALFGRVVDAAFFDGFGIVSGAIQSPKQFRRESRSGGEVRHSFHSFRRRHGHDPGDDGDIDSG